MRFLFFFFATLTALLGLGSPAHAQPNVAPAKPERTWYGWQTLLVDAASTTFLFTQLPEARSLIGLAGYVVGGPIIHLAHGRFAEAGISFGLRAGLPFVGAGIGAAVWSATSEKCQRTYDGDDCTAQGYEALGVLLLGGVIGAGTAVALDAAVLARVTKHPPPRSTGPRFGVHPTKAGMTATVGGVF